MDKYTIAATPAALHAGDGLEVEARSIEDAVEAYEAAGGDYCPRNPDRVWVVEPDGTDGWQDSPSSYTSDKDSYDDDY